MNMKNTRNLLALALFVAATGCSDDKANNAPDAAASDAAQTATTVSLSSTGHLVDKDGKTLYFYVNDVVGAPSKCPVGACLTKWPAFDAQSPTVGTGLTAADFARVDRGDGTGFQASWKGRPLYYYSLDASVGATTGDAVGGIWFVARAYNFFYATATTTAITAPSPLGGTGTPPTFITDGAGRTVYVFKTDTRAAAGGAPTSGCTSDTCKGAWPVWEKGAAVTTPVIPSTMKPEDVTSFMNPNEAKVQFVYKGWPMYHHTPDVAPGAVSGTAVAGWFAVSVGFDGTLP